jgi:hypothetical protein
MMTIRNQEKLSWTVSELEPRVLGVGAESLNLRELEKPCSEFKNRFGKLAGVFASAGFVLTHPICDGGMKQI